MKANKYVHSLFFILLIGGCQTAFNLTRSASEFQSLIACETAAVVLTDKNTDSSVTPSKKYKRSECPECHGKGYIVSGDGLFKQDCPYCEADASFGSTKLSGCECDKCSCKECKCTKGKNCICAGGKDCKEFNVQNTQNTQKAQEINKKTQPQAKPQPQPQPQRKKSTPTYIYSNGQRCSGGG